MASRSQQQQQQQQQQCDEEWTDLLPSSDDGGDDEIPSARELAELARLLGAPEDPRMKRWTALAGFAKVRGSSHPRGERVVGWAGQG